MTTLMTFVLVGGPFWLTSYLALRFLRREISDSIRWRKCSQIGFIVLLDSIVLFSLVLTTFVAKVLPNGCPPPKEVSELAFPIILVNGIGIPILIVSTVAEWREYGDRFN